MKIKQRLVELYFIRFPLVTAGIDLLGRILLLRPYHGHTFVRIVPAPHARFASIVEHRRAHIAHLE